MPREASKPLVGEGTYFYNITAAHIINRRGPLTIDINS
jgi:hypothetical protein